MTTAARVESGVTVAQPSRRLGKGALVWSWMTSTDHKVIAKLYLWTALAFFAFGGLLALNACAFWGGPSVSKPSPAAMRQLPVLFVQTQYDAATNTDGANAFFAQLPGARRVYVTRDFQHGVFPYDDSCVDPQVTAYLLGETPV